MAGMMIRIADLLHRVTMAVCQVLFVTIFMAVLATVILRYGFSSGFIWLQDLGLYAFGVFAILTLPCAMHADRHVRVDVVRAQQSVTAWRKTDWIAVVGFATPVFLLLFAYSLPEAINSIRISESSPQIGGLPFYHLVKAAIPLAAALMLVQAFGYLAKSMRQKADA